MKLFPFAGLFALIWFLIRVIPKPSRAAYPCQRVAFPMASSFIIWLLGLAGSVAAYRKATTLFRKPRSIAVVFALAVSIAMIWAAMSADIENLPVLKADPLPANSPIGIARGIHPGRVVWIHDPNAAHWTGSDGITTPPYWYSDTSTNPQIVSEMLSKALRALTGKTSDYTAWDTLFRDFNQRMGRGNVGYEPGEKIAIKVNFTLSYENNPTGGRSSFLYDQIDESPQLTIALLKQLTNTVGSILGISA